MLRPVVERLTRELIGSVEWNEPTPADEVDGLSPHALFLPEDEAGVIAVLTAAARDGLAVCPRGGGTRMQLGNLPGRLDLVLSLGRLNQVVEYVPADLTITVGAGMRLGDLQALLAQHGQTLPLDPATGGGRSTLGGIVAANADGPMRLAYGGVRDLLLGARVILADGRAVKTGGRVVKNVAGYDLNKLLVGSLGTLGVMTELTFKLRPLPEAVTTLRLPFVEAAEALDRAEAILNSELLPAALTVLSPPAAARLETPGPWCLAVRLAESRTNLAYQAGRIVAGGAAGSDQLEGAPEEDFWERVRHFGSHYPVATRVNSTISEVGAHLQHEGCAAIAHVGTGTVYLYSEDVPTWIHGLMRMTGGTTVVEAAPAEAKQGLDVFGPERPEWRLMQSIKRAFDPAGTLNPGRFVGGI